LETGGALVKSRFEWTETSDNKEWDEFVIRNGGSFFHLWSWRNVLEESGAKAKYLVCRDAGGNVVGACPFLDLPGKSFHHLVSLPDSRTAGPLLDGRVNAPEILGALPKSVKFSISSPVVAMKIKTHLDQIIAPMRALGFPYEATRGLYILDLEAKTLEDVWNDGFKKHDRQAVKYYEQKSAFGFTKNYGDFLALSRPTAKYTFEMIDQMQVGFIKTMKAVLGDLLEVALVTGSDGAALAGLILQLDASDSPTRGVHLQSIRHAAPRNIHSVVTSVNWAVVSWAYKNGFRYVDFGAYPIDKSSDPTHPFYALKTKFKIRVAPRFIFTVPTSNLSYSIARRINQVVLPLKGSRN
jgi:hypothetical protein